MMKKLVFVFAICVFAAGTASADFNVTFTGQGTGNMVYDSPVVYTGPVIGGDLVPGTWTISIDDTGWPPTTNPTARWDYIWNTFYEYTPANPPIIPDAVWTATFDTPLTASRPALFLDHQGTGTMSGVADMRFQVIDADGDMVLDPDECDGDGLSGIVIIIEDGTDYYADQCGNGSYQGGYTRNCSTWDDNVVFQMSIDLWPCGMAAEPASWGAIKALYQ